MRGSELVWYLEPRLFPFGCATVSADLTSFRFYQLIRHTVHVMIVIHIALRATLPLHCKTNAIFIAFRWPNLPRVVNWLRNSVYDQFPCCLT